MAKFKNLIPPQAKVWRDGVKKSIEASLIVPGDIVEVDGGDKIPADIRILEVTHPQSVTHSHTLNKPQTCRHLLHSGF